MSADVRVLVNGYTFASIDIGEEAARLLRVESDERPFGGVYKILVDNSDSSLEGISFEGKTLLVYFGFIGSEGSYIPTLTVEKQRIVSYEGTLALELTCFDNWGFLSFFKGAAGGTYWNHPNQNPDYLDTVLLPVSNTHLPDDLKTLIAAQYDKTCWEIITSVVGSTIDVTISEDEEDSLMDSTPIVGAPDARSILMQVLENTNSYGRLSANQIHFVKPSAYDVVYTFNLAKLFYSNAEETEILIPNKIVYHGVVTDGETGDQALIFTASPHGEDAASIAIIGEIPEHLDYDPINRMNSTDQGMVNDKADVRIGKLQLSRATGTFEAPMHCSLELFDKVSLTDDRYDTPRTITGYVFRIIREYDRGVYKITVQLGGVVSEYTPSTGGNPVVSMPTPNFLPNDPVQVLPRAIQGYNTNVAFSASSQTAIAWTAGTVKFYDGTTLSISSGNTTLTETDIHYIYFDLDDAVPGTLKVIREASGGYNSVMTEHTGLLCIVQKGTSSGINANVIPSYGKQPLITPDLINMTGVLNYDYGDGKKIQSILSTQVSAGNLKLTSTTVKDGVWYSQSGVIIDASTGIEIQGDLDLKFSYGGSYPCYIYTGTAGDLVLLPYTNKAVYVLGNLGIASGYKFGLLLSTGADGTLYWTTNGGTRNHAFSPETDNMGYLGDAVYSWKEVNAYAFVDWTHKAYKNAIDKVKAIRVDEADNYVKASFPDTIYRKANQEELDRHKNSLREAAINQKKKLEHLAKQEDISQEDRDFMLERSKVIVQEAEAKASQLVSKEGTDMGGKVSLTLSAVMELIDRVEKLEKKVKE